MGFSRLFRGFFRFYWSASIHYSRLRCRPERTGLCCFLISASLSAGAAPCPCLGEIREPEPSGRLCQGPAPRGWNYSAANQGKAPSALGCCSHPQTNAPAASPSPGEVEFQGKKSLFSSSSPTGPENSPLRTQSCSAFRSLSFSAR